MGVPVGESKMVERGVRVGVGEGVYGTSMEGSEVAVGLMFMGVGVWVGGTGVCTGVAVGRGVEVG